MWVNNTPELDEPLLRQKINLAKILDGKGFAGFTAATGGSTAVQDVLEWHLKSG